VSWVKDFFWRFFWWCVCVKGRGGSGSELDCLMELAVHRRERDAIKFAYLRDSVRHIF